MTRRRLGGIGSRLPVLNRLDPSKQSIMWGLLLLVALFLAGLWIMSTLNLTFSQRAMTDLRQQQIAEGFRASLARIDNEHRRLEQYINDLADQAQRFPILLAERRSSIGEMENDLVRRLQRFPDAFAAGVWYRPDVVRANGPLGVLAYRAEQGVSLYRSEHSHWQDYQQQLWFPLALGENWQPDAEGNLMHYWTPVYFNPLTDAPVISLVRPIITDDGHSIGLASVDWHAESLIELVSEIRMTPGTFAWLIDRNDRRLSSLSQIDDALQAEQIMMAVEQRMQAPGTGPDDRGAIEVDGRHYELLHATTRGGMQFGVGVPQDEIEAVLAPMRSTNRQILLLGGLGILILSGLILLKVVALMRELQTSYTDELTGLPNRARLLQDLHQRKDGALILLNIDRFRELNGLFGHTCGDYILTTLASRLQALKAEDSSGQGLYRLGADEFALLGRRQDNETLVTKLQIVLHGIAARPLHWQGYEINLNATLGAAVLSAGQTTRQLDLISEAQEALKHARQQGLSYQVQDCEQSLEQLFEHNLLWANRLREALRSDGLEPWFQPILNIDSGRVEKYECLVRMRDAEGGVVSPGLFLGVARQLRLDREITRLMMTKCCHHFADSELQFSINLAYGDLRDESLTAFILELLDQTGIGPRLIFEILESDGIDNYDQVRRFIEEVKKRGCRIAIDDFGTGYSNFEHLLRMDVDLLKIDGSLIRHLHTDANARRVTRGIVSFAHSLGIQTVAEFVHSEAVLTQVRALGIDFAQGEVVGMPLPGLLEHD